MSAKAKVAQMTVDELKEIVGAAVEQKLVDLFGDPDAGITMKKSLRQRLTRQRKAVAAGRRGEAFDDVVQRLRLS